MHMIPGDIVPDKILTLDDLKEIAPTVFAFGAVDNPDLAIGKVIGALKAKGFVPVDFDAKKVREGTKTGLRGSNTPYFMRFAQPNSFESGRDYAQIVVFHRPDSSGTLYRIYAGYKRAGSNHFVVAGTERNTSVVRKDHGTVELNQAIAYIVGKLRELDDIVARMRVKQLRYNEVKLLSLNAILKRWDRQRGHDNSHSVSREDYEVDDHAINSALRADYDDQSDDLWTMFNRVQDAVIKGDLELYSPKKAAKTPNDPYRNARNLGDVIKMIETSILIWELAYDLLDQRG